MSFNIGPKTLENDDVEIETDNNGFLLTHVPTGNTLRLKDDGTAVVDALEAVSQETDLIGSLSQDKNDNKLVLDDNGDPGFLKFQKRSNGVGNNAPPSDANTAIVYCESGELVAMDQVGNLTQIT